MCRYVCAYTRAHECLSMKVMICIKMCASTCSCPRAAHVCVLIKQPHTMLEMQVALCGAYQRDHAPQSCGASQRLATPRNALATRISRTRYAQRPERDSTAGERNESNAMHRRHRARQTYEIATMCTFQSTVDRYEACRADELQEFGVHV